MSPEVVDRLVVGGGMTGLVAAWRGRLAGLSVRLLEAAPRVGGVVRTERVGAYRLERAAASFPSTAAHLREVVESLPGAPTIRTPAPETDKQFLLARRGLLPVPKSPPALIRTPLLSAGAKVRIFAEMAIGPRRARTPETAFQFVRRRFGRQVAERFLKPVTLGIYGTSPEDLGLADAFPMLAEMERSKGGVLRGMPRRRGGEKRRIVLFDDGMEAFPRAIAAALGDAVRLSAPVAGLSREGDLVRVATAGGEAHLAREVVLATTAPDQARLAAPHSAHAAEVLAAVRYVPMVVVGVGIPPGGSPPIPPSFGFLKAPGAGVRILGASFPSWMNPVVAPEGHHLVTVFAGGGGDPGAIELSDDEVRDMVVSDLSRALSGPVRPDLVSICRWPRAIPVLSPGHRARMAEAQALLAPLRVRLWGSHLTGVGVHSCCAPLPAA